MLTSPELVSAIYLLGGTIFLGALFAGFLRTLARVILYSVKGIPRPRLLTRDVLVVGGFSLSFGLITVVRFLPLDNRIVLTTGNVLWALLTTVPACVAVLAYLYFEVLVIERAPEIPDPVNGEAT